jgi:hypothetical protein
MLYYYVYPNTEYKIVYTGYDQYLVRRCWKGHYVANWVTSVKSCRVGMGSVGIENLKYFKPQIVPIT